MAVLNFDIKTVTLPNGSEAKAVFLTGSIDASTNQAFEGRLSDILSSGTTHVLLVLTNVKYINSTGLGTIVKCVDTFREKGGDIKLVGVPTKVIALFEMLGLLALFETHETIEAAVASFSKSADSNKPAATPAAKFPIQFKHPVTGMGLNVSQPGRFKDPRSGDYFSVDTNGTIEFYEMTKVKLLEAKVPCDIDFTASLVSLAEGLAKHLKASDDVRSKVNKGLSDACALIRSKSTDANETCNVLLVGDQDKIQIGFVNHGNALNISTDEAGYKALLGSMDDVKHQVLPTRGFLLTMTKRLR